MTRDFIVNEVVMRADPGGRSMGEFIRDEIAAPLGITGQVKMISDSYILLCRQSGS